MKISFYYAIYPTIVNRIIGKKLQPFISNFEYLKIKLKEKENSILRIFKSNTRKQVSFTMIRTHHYQCVLTTQIPLAHTLSLSLSLSLFFFSLSLSLSAPVPIHLITWQVI